MRASTDIIRTRKERAMKTFVFLTYGFEKPTPEIMKAWNLWFESIKDNIVDQYGLTNGREISKDGTRNLPLDLESITGVMVVSAKNIDDAEKMAQRNPYITSIRVYEIMQK
jgi:hypothetical protein